RLGTAWFPSRLRLARISAKAPACFVATAPWLARCSSLAELLIRMLHYSFSFVSAQEFIDTRPLAEWECAGLLRRGGWRSDEEAAASGRIRAKIPLLCRIFSTWL